MSRDITTLNKDASKADVVTPILFVFMDFDSPLYVNTSPYPFSFGGNEYLGVGTLGKIEAIEEGTNIQARNIRLQLSGIPPELITIALDEHYQGKSCIVYLGFLDSDHALIDDPFIVFSGLMDVMDINIGKTAEIMVTAENKLADWARPRISRYTNVDQQEKYPNDKGLEFVAEMADIEIVWGRG